MQIKSQIHSYISSLSDSKSRELNELHLMMLEVMPNARLWYLDGKDENGKRVSNPNIGYGLQTLTSANGKTREFYQIGLSANTSGISVYIIGLIDKTLLAKKYSDTIGKATITNYCIKFKTLKDINIEILLDAVRYGVQNT